MTAGLSDGQLLDRFLAGRDGIDEVAFAALMERHGPMVFQVCKRILGNSHDAQDAFQATFFVLIRKAESIRRCESVGSWLFGVARRVAMRGANADAARRRTHELQAAENKTTASSVEGDQAESWATLHEQIDRMPEKYRKPIVLCLPGGLDHRGGGSARRISKGTVLSRLAREGAIACGFGLPELIAAGGSAGRIDPESETAKESTSADLFERTVRASLKFANQPATATNVSSAAASPSPMNIRAMTMTKLRIYGATVFATRSSRAAPIPSVASSTTARETRAQNASTSGPKNGNRLQLVRSSPQGSTQATRLHWRAI